MHTATVAKKKYEADYLRWLNNRLAKGGLPLHMVELYSATVKRLEDQR